MIKSVQGKMSLLMAGFTMLVLLSVTASFTLIDAHDQDAQQINKAGSQRKLLQQIVRMALQFGQDGKPEHLHSLEESAATFEQVLFALESGENRDPQISQQLERVKMGWRDFKPSVELVVRGKSESPGLSTAISSIGTGADVLVNEVERLVRLYEASSKAKVERLRLVQLVFLAGAIMALGFGGILTQASIFKPLKQLSRASERIGGGDLLTPIQVSGPHEIRKMSMVFEKMRADLNISQSKLIELACCLEEQVIERMQELEALFSVSRDITSHLELNEVLQTVTDRTNTLLAGDAAFLCLLDEEGQTLKLHAYSGNSSAVLTNSSPACNSPAAQVLTGSRALHCSRDVCRDSCQIISPVFRASHLVAPLKLGGQNNAALCVSSRNQDAFSGGSCSQMDKLAHVAEIALKNARQYQQAERAAMLGERQRIAAELHDGVAQSISTIQMAVDQAKLQVEWGKIESAIGTLTQTRAATDQSIADVRKAISSLQEEYPLSITLQDLLAGLVAEFSKQGCEVQWEEDVAVPIVLPRHESEQILRVVREGLLNAYSHSNSSLVILRLSVNRNVGIISVEDNGQGFDMAKHVENGRNGRHFGLKIMKARAARIGGSLEIRSSPGRGTCVELSWPLGFSTWKRG